MPHWVKLTSANDQRTPVFVNLDNVTHLLPRNPGSRVCFPGDDDAYISVAEEPEHIARIPAIR